MVIYHLLTLLIVNEPKFSSLELPFAPSSPLHLLSLYWGGHSIYDDFYYFVYKTLIEILDLPKSLQMKQSFEYDCLSIKLKYHFKAPYIDTDLLELILIEPC